MGQEYEYQVLRTYARAWRLERVIYRIENFTLPFPISMDQLMVFGACELLLFLVSFIPGLGDLMKLRPFVAWGIVPFALTWYLTRYAVDGKSPFWYVRSRFRHWFGPRLINRYRAYGLPWWQPRQMYVDLRIVNNLPTTLKKALRAGR